MLATLQSRDNAEWRVTARYVHMEKSCVNEDRETSVIGKELYKSLQTLEAWWNTNGFVIIILRARLEDKGNIVLVYLLTGITNHHVGWGILNILRSNFN